MFDTKRSRQMLVLILMSPLIVALLALMALAPLYLVKPEWVLRDNISAALIEVSVAIDLTVMVAGGVTAAVYIKYKITDWINRGRRSHT